MTGSSVELPGPAELAAGLAGRLRDIEAITDAALSRLDERALLGAVLERVRTVLDADTATVLLLDRLAGQLVATAASGIEEEVTQGVRVPLGAGFAGTVAASAQPLILNRIDESTVRNRLLIDRGLKSLLGVPLLAGGQVIGVLHVGSQAGRPFTQEDVELLRLAADRAALAVQSMTANDDRVAALALQRSLRPPALPAVPGLELAARYVAGSGSVGGDWYDVFVLPGGGVGMVVGDVAGSGVQAAVIMGRMRSALRAYMLQDEDPGTVLRLLDRKIQYFEPDAMATVQYAVCQPGTGQVTISSAGHLPPVLAVPGAVPGPVTLEVDPPLGVCDDIPRRSTMLEVPPGALLCSYTDGLVERRAEVLDTGIGMVAAVLGEAMGAAGRRPGMVPVPEAACAAVMRALIGSTSPMDDVAVLMLHRRPGHGAGDASLAG
jgi:putative methionine-R-sulfoxide reductase with GAF domain